MGRGWAVLRLSAHPLFFMDSLTDATFQQLQDQFGNTPTSNGFPTGTIEGRVASNETFTQQIAITQPAGTNWFLIAAAVLFFLWATRQHNFTLIR